MATFAPSIFKHVYYFDPFNPFSVIHQSRLSCFFFHSTNRSSFCDVSEKSGFEVQSYNNAQFFKAIIIKLTVCYTVSWCYNSHSSRIILKHFVFRISRLLVLKNRLNVNTDLLHSASFFFQSHLRLTLIYRYRNDIAYYVDDVLNRSEKYFGIDRDRN